MGKMKRKNEDRREKKSEGKKERGKGHVSADLI
jgi:hypothetical protein